MSTEVTCTVKLTTSDATRAEINLAENDEITKDQID